MWVAEELIDTVKTHRKCLRRRFRLEVNRHKDSIFIMVVFVPCGLVQIAIKPFSYGRHHARKLSGAYADRDAAHDPLVRRLRM